MATVIGANREEFILREMARRAGKKYEPEQPSNPFQGLDKTQIKEQSKLLKEAKKELKAKKAE